MNQLYKNIDKAILKAGDNLYLKHNKITLSGSRINGAKVPWHVYKAIAERIKYNANLHNKKSGQSRIILNIAGKQKIFKVNLSRNGALTLLLVNLSA